VGVGLEALAVASKVSDAGSELGFETIENCEVEPDSEPDSNETESVPWLGLGLGLGLGLALTLTLP